MNGEFLKTIGISAICTIVFLLIFFAYMIIKECRDKGDKHTNKK
jgi:hypothetical protein